MREGEVEISLLTCIPISAGTQHAIFTLLIVIYIPGCTVHTIIYTTRTFEFSTFIIMCLAYTAVYKGIHFGYNIPETPVYKYGHINGGVENNVHLKVFLTPGPIVLNVYSVCRVWFP